LSSDSEADACPHQWPRWSVLQGVAGNGWDDRALAAGRGRAGTARGEALAPHRTGHIQRQTGNPFGVRRAEEVLGQALRIVNLQTAWQLSTIDTVIGRRAEPTTGR